MKHLALAALAVSMMGVQAAPAAPTMEQVLKAGYSIKNFSELQLSPDGSRLAFRVTGTSDRAKGPVRTSNLYVVPAAGGQWTPLSVKGAMPANDERDPQWSPDGKQIAFLSDAASKGQPQIYVVPSGGGDVRRVSTLNGDVQALHWSPDGTQLAILYIPSAHRQSGALAPGARDVGVVGSVVDEQRIAIVPAGGGNVRVVTPPDDYVYEYDWAPDGRSFAFTYAPGNGDDNWWVAKLASIGADGSGMRDVLAPKFQINAPRWSPDGKSIAIIGGIMSDFGSTGGDVYLVDAAGGNARDLTGDATISAQSLQWADAQHLDLVADSSGAMHLMQLDVADGTLTALTDRPEAVRSWSIARGGAVAAFVRNSFEDPPEIWAGPPNAPVRITNSNAGVPRYWGKSQSLTWKSDRFTAQGWLIYPLAYDPAKRYPMVTIIHGGPSAMSAPAYGSTFVSALSSQGFFVFQPNPRGSFGEGEAFTAANVKDFGFGDWRDDLGGVDAAIASASIDPQRLGLFGWSYGGYMGMWAETQTARFKAIVAGAGVVNWQSYYGQNKIDQWMIPFFGASVYDDPAVYAKSSPITYIKQSKTPVLILQGELDEEVPAPQAFEFWHAMKTLGVPTELMVYAGEGHSPQKPADQIDILTRMVGWFRKYL